MGTLSYIWGALGAELTLDPIRCNLGVKSSQTRRVPSGQNEIFPLRGYIAETYAKVMGSSSPSQPSLKPECDG